MQNQDQNIYTLVLLAFCLTILMGIFKPGKMDGVRSRSMVSYIGMSSIGISVEQLLAHENASSQEIKHFQRE